MKKYLNGFGCLICFILMSTAIADSTQIKLKSFVAKKRDLDGATDVKELHAEVYPSGLITANSTLVSPAGCPKSYTISSVEMGKAQKAVPETTGSVCNNMGGFDKAVYDACMVFSNIKSCCNVAGGSYTPPRTVYRMQDDKDGPPVITRMVCEKVIWG